MEAFGNFARPKSVRWRALKVAASAVLMAAPGVFAGGVDFTYDALGRIATVVYNNGTATTTITYSYDAVGNRTSVVTTSP